MRPWSASTSTRQKTSLHLSHRPLSSVLSGLATLCLGSGSSMTSIPKLILTIPRSCWPSMRPTSLMAMISNLLRSLLNCFSPQRCQTSYNLAGTQSTFTRAGQPRCKNSLASSAAWRVNRQIAEVAALSASARLLTAQRLGLRCRTYRYRSMTSYTQSRRSATLPRPRSTQDGAPRI